MKKEISLYIHIPFCVNKCNYCDFLSFPACTGTCKAAYINALQREMELYAKEADQYRVVSVYIGGGTPSILSLEQIEMLMYTLREVWDVDADAEITIEMNPGTADQMKLLGYRQLGINRISMGLQTTNKEELACLGRIYNYDHFYIAWKMLREAGFDNINIDIMMGLPGQTFQSYQKTLSKVLSLRPEHVSAYSLIIEENTPFYNNPAVLSQLPDEETERMMYTFTKNFLEGYGYCQYEISNYAVEGRECRHNIVYWEDRSYLGLGLGASSYMSGNRFTNTADLEYYIQYYNDEKCVSLMPLEKTVIDTKTHMEEFMFLGLRMMQGVSRQRFKSLFGKDIYDVYGTVLNKYEGMELLTVSGDSVSLTAQGVSLSNIIMADFLL